MRSIASSRRQSALAWELRTATTYARLLAMQGRHSEAHGVLAPVLRSFDDGFATSDLAGARRMLEALQRDGSGRARSDSTRARRT